MTLKILVLKKKLINEYLFFVFYILFLIFLHFIFNLISLARNHV